MTNLFAFFFGTALFLGSSVFIVDESVLDGKRGRTVFESCLVVLEHFGYTAMGTVGCEQKTQTQIKYDQEVTEILRESI